MKRSIDLGYAQPFELFPRKSLGESIDGNMLKIIYPLYSKLKKIKILSEELIQYEKWDIK